MAVINSNFQDSNWVSTLIDQHTNNVKKYILQWSQIVEEIGPDAEIRKIYTEIFENKVKERYEDLIEDMENLYKQQKDEIVILKDELDMLADQNPSLQISLEVEPLKYKPIISVKNDLLEKINQYKKKIEEEEGKKIAEYFKKDYMDFIQQQKKLLDDLWGMCYCSMEQRNDFIQFYSTDYSFDLCKDFSKETQKWLNYYIENRDILDLIRNYEKELDNLLELQVNSNKIDLYKNRGGVMLDYVNQHKVLVNKISKYEESILKMARTYKKLHKKDFFVNNMRLEDYLKKHKNSKQTKDMSPILIKNKEMQKNNNLKKVPIPKITLNNTFRTPASKTTLHGTKSTLKTKPNNLKNTPAFATTKKVSPKQIKNVVKKLKNKEDEGWSTEEEEYVKFQKAISPSSRSTMYEKK